MGKRGGRPRKIDVDRYPGGQIIYDPRADFGHPRTIWRRAVIVGERYCWDARADHTAGQSYLLRYLEDPPQPGIKRADRERRALQRYSAIENFTKLHRYVFGLHSARSNLSSSVAGMRSPLAAVQASADNVGAARRLARMIKRVLEIEGAPHAYQVLQLVALDEGPVDLDGQPDARRLSDSQRIWLRLAGDALLERAQAADEAEPAERVTKKPRATSYQPLFTGDREGVDDARLFEALEKLRGGRRAPG